MNLRPNILHILCDQLRFDAIGALGNSYVRTPNLDRLVQEGTAFTRAYSPCPECVPARASMITGWYPGRTGCYSNQQSMPPEDTPTLMSRLTDAGYRTHGVGKCHFTPSPVALRGFQSRQTMEEVPDCREEDDYLQWLSDHGWDWVVEAHGVRGGMYYIPQPSVLPPQAHPTHWVADRSLDFIEEETGQDRPWYLYTSFVHPHPPFSPPVPWHKLYAVQDMPLPDLPPQAGELLTFINHYQNRYKYRDRGLDLNLIRCMRAYYHSCVAFIDAQVGRLMRMLEASGELDNTLIVFSADHGEYLGDYGCFGKRGMHDVSARIPMIVRWPGAERAGSRCDQPASLIDLAPTFLEAAGADPGQGALDGLSLRAVADGETRRDVVFSQYNTGPDGLYMALDRRWKYIFSAPDQKELLFDHRTDPAEHRNLAGDPAAGEVLAALRSRCLDWVRAQGQTNVADANGWKTYPVKTVPKDPDEGLIIQDPSWWDGRLPDVDVPRQPRAAVSCSTP